MNFRTFFFFMLMIVSSRAAPVAMGDGETLTYRIGWGIFPGAGEIVVKAQAEAIDGLSQIRVTTKTATRGFVRSIYPFDGNGESLFDGTDGRLLAAKAATSAGKKKTNAMAVFDYPANKVRYVDYVQPQRSAELPMPPGYPMDLITSLVQTRVWKLKLGEHNTVVVMFDKEFYEVTITAERYEQVHTTLGDFQTLVLVPSMEKNPRGVFRRGGRIRVWISQDARQLPVKFELSMGFGTGTAVLSDYRPPAVRVADANPRS